MEIKVKSAHISRIYLNMILQLTPESHCVRSLRVGTSLAHSTLPSFWSHISCFWRHFEAVLLETYSFMNNISDALSLFCTATLSIQYKLMSMYKQSSCGHHLIGSLSVPASWYHRNPVQIRACKKTAAGLSFIQPINSICLQSTANQWTGPELSIRNRFNW